MNSVLIGYEYVTPDLSAKDEKAIFDILAKYETTNAMFDPSIRGDLRIKDIDENKTYDANGNEL